MRITEGQLKRLIRGVLLSEALPKSQTDTPSDSSAFIKDIDWSKCGLPDPEAWNKYTQDTYLNSIGKGKTKKMQVKPSDDVASNMQAGAITIPVFWSTMVSLIGNPGLAKNLGVKLSVKGYEETFKSFVANYKKLAGGKDIHAPTFASNIFKNIVLDKTGGLGVITKQYVEQKTGRDGRVNDKLVMKATGVYARFLLEIFKEGVKKYAQCNKDISSGLKKSVDDTLSIIISQEWPYHLKDVKWYLKMPLKKWHTNFTSAKKELEELEKKKS